MSEKTFKSFQSIIKPGYEKLISKGLINSQIASGLGISEETTNRLNSLLTEAQLAMSEWDDSHCSILDSQKNADGTVVNLELQSNLKNTEMILAELKLKFDSEAPNLPDLWNTVVTLNPTLFAYENPRFVEVYLPANDSPAIVKIYGHKVDRTKVPEIKQQIAPGGKVTYTSPFVFSTGSGKGDNFSGTFKMDSPAYRDRWGFLQEIK